MKKINCLSLFNGHSGAFISLIEAGYDIDNYYSSEIDKQANKAATAINKNTIHMGDVRLVNVCELKKIDILMGGSPCTDLSIAGTQSGLICDTYKKYLKIRNEWLITRDESLYFFNGKFQESILFWEYYRIWNEIKAINPDAVFFLENVAKGVSKTSLAIMSNALELQPVRLNSNRLSAQNRDRNYWFSGSVKEYNLFGDKITDIPTPPDLKLTIKDVLQPENEVDGKYYLSEKMMKGFIKGNPNFKGRFKPFINLNNKANCVTTKPDRKEGNFVAKLSKDGKLKDHQNKASCLTGGGNSGGNHSDMDVICVSMVGGKLDEKGTRKDNDKNIETRQVLEPNLSNKSNCLTTVNKDNLLLYQKARGNNKGGLMGDKCTTITANAWEQNNILLNDYAIRRFTPKECGRLQTFPEWALDVLLNCGVSDTALYRGFGNGWTIAVIVWILKHWKH